MDEQVRHPIFARVYDRLSAKAEDAGQDAHRRQLLSGLRGRVIEVGAGNGLNFRHYPAAVRRVAAIEPEDYLHRRATEAAKAATAAIDVVRRTADQLPVEDESFDAGVASLVLCSVPDQARALAELHRVIRPGGELRFYEHVRADERRLARLQDVILPVWRLLAGGCHPTAIPHRPSKRQASSSRSCGGSTFGRRSSNCPQRPASSASPGALRSCLRTFRGVA